MSDETPGKDEAVIGAAAADAQTEEEVAGERRIGSINRVRSLQARVSNVLAIGLLSVLAVGFLAWYYVHTYHARSDARQSAQSTSKGKAQGDMPLPPLGAIDQPNLGGNPDGSMFGDAMGDAPDEPPEGIPEAWLRPAEDPEPVGSAPAAPRVKTAEEMALERRLSGAAFSRLAESGALMSALAISANERDASENADSFDSAESGGSELASLLKPTATAAVRAKVLPTQRLLLPKGAFIDCTLETAIDSTLPGMTTCVTATDTFGVDGSTVLLERGTKLVGETRGQVQQGAARVFVLWSEARTPTGVVIPLASPGTDELGRSGLAGTVNRHFFERFGAAILISMIDGAVHGAVQSSGGGTVIYNPSASEDIMTEALKSTVNIPPTVTKAHGDRIQVMVARDLDFRAVYELRPSHGR